LKSREQLGIGAKNYINKSGKKYARIVSRSNDGERCYITYFHSDGNVIYYNIYISLDYELAEYIYSINKGTLISYIAYTDRLTVDIGKARNLVRDCGKEYFISSAEAYIAEIYNEKLGLYLYFKISNDGSISNNDGAYAVFHEPMGEEVLGGVPHRVDINQEKIELTQLHSIEKKVADDCRVYYSCTDCGNIFNKNEREHLHTHTLIAELTETDAKAEYVECSRCNETYLSFTDSRDNNVKMWLGVLASQEISYFDITGDAEAMTVLRDKMEYIGENGIFDRTINIPDITDVTGKTLVGISNFYTKGGVDFAASVVVPEGVIFIRTYAFRFDVLSISLPETLKYVETTAFAVSSSMTELTIPQSVVRFDYQDNLYNLESLTVNADNMVLFYVPRMNTYSIDYSGVESIEKIYFGSRLEIENVEIPEGTKEFYGLQGNIYIRKVSIPLSIEKIPDQCFKGCTFLTEVTVPNTLTQLPFDMFVSCKALTTLRVTDENGDVIGNYGEILIPAGIEAVAGFKDCTSITRVLLPDSLKEIGKNAFYGCTSLSYIRMPEGVQAVGENAFYGCFLLGDECFVFSNKIQSIGNNAFYGTNLKNFVLLSDSVYVKLDYEIFGGTLLDSLVINGKTLNMYFQGISEVPISIEEITVFVSPINGGTYGISGTKTVNIRYLEATENDEGEISKLYIHESVETVNFIGTKEQFEALNIHMHGDNTVVNYNVVFE